MSHPNSLKERYRHLFPELKRLSRGETLITEANVYQKANMNLRPFMDCMCADSMLPTSEIRGIDAIQRFLDTIKAGKRGLILMEHYSNFDLPGLIYLLNKQGPIGHELAERIIAIAGMKLNEEDPYVAAFAEGYSRIIIYPSRQLAAIKDPEQYKIEEQRSKVINLASMRALDKARKEGNVVLVFPSGTRYRPGKPETKRGVREIDSYVRLSDSLLLISVNGNCLRISDNPSDMLEDITCQDRIILTAGGPWTCDDFRAEALAWAEDGNCSTDDKKQMVVDYVMHRLEIMHEENEKGRL